MAKTKSDTAYAYLRQIRDEGQGRYGDGRGGLGLSLLVKKTVAGRCSKTWSPEAPHRQSQAGITHSRIWFMATVVTLADARA